MPSIEVCRHLGYSQWRNQPEAYLDAKREATKRINNNDIEGEDCRTIAKMAMDDKRESAKRLEKMMDSMKTYQTDCTETITGFSCTTDKF